MKGTSDSLRERIRMKKSDVFWVDLVKTDEEGDRSDAGKLLISFELVPIDRA